MKFIVVSLLLVLNSIILVYAANTVTNEVANNGITIGWIDSTQSSCGTGYTTTTLAELKTWCGVTGTPSNWAGSGQKCGASSSVTCPFFSGGGSAIRDGISQFYAMPGGDGLVACMGTDNNQPNTYGNRIFSVTAAASPYYSSWASNAVTYFPNQLDNSQNVKLGQSLCTRTVVAPTPPTPTPPSPTPPSPTPPTPPPPTTPTTPVNSASGTSNSESSANNDGDSPSLKAGKTAAATIFTIGGAGGMAWLAYFIRRRLQEQAEENVPKQVPTHEEEHNHKPEKEPEIALSNIYHTEVAV